MRALFLVLAAMLSSQEALAQRSLRAHRVESPPVIDGHLDETAWQSADAVAGFRQRAPHEGEPASERTEVRVLYDNSSLYVGARLYDREPDKVVTRLSRRDDDADADKFNFYVDPLHDHLTGAVFQVSAGGQQADWIISNDTTEESSWDAVWESAVSLDAEGWSVEMRIPLSQFRFLKSDNQTWGFNVERVIYRRGESAWLELVPRGESGLASRMIPLTDIEGIAPHRTLEIVPYTAARSAFIDPHAAGNPFNDGSRYSGGAGFDLKYALRSNMILNATVNPDFGQVEIDPAVVNLGAFETFFPEKRPFFIQGAQIFGDFGNLGANDRLGFNRTEPDLIHTRRIGRVPQGAASGEFVDTPSSTTILGAAKLTGKTGRGWSFGVLDALTDREYAEVSDAGKRSRTEVEPRTNYFAGRLLKEFGNGRSGLGTLFTSVNRELRDPALKDLLVKRANIAGVDGYHFLDTSHDWVINGRLVFSDVSGTSASIERLQLEPQRYFQRPETPQVSFDPSRTGLRGWTGDVNLNRNQGAVTVNAAIWGVSPGFESGDLGFHYGGDAWGSHIAVDWKQIKHDRFTRDRNVKLAKFYVWDYGRAKMTDGVMALANLTFLNYWGFGGNVGLFARAQDNKLTRGGPPALQLPSGNSSLYLNTDYRKNFVLHFNGGRSWDDGGGGSGNGGFSLEWKPSSRMNLSSGPSYSHSVNVAQYVTTVDDPLATATYGKRFVFGRLQEKQLSIDTRVNMLFTPKISLQLYMQPLVAVGKYMDFKSLARPRTFEFDRYAGPLDDPDFNFKSLRVNAIFRWEWRLGSTLFVAWTQQREDLRDPGQFQAGRDVSRVFSAPADNVFLIKITRWFSR